MRRRIVTLILGAVLTGCQATGPEPGSPSLDDTSERLLAAPPDGWVTVFQSNRPGIRLIEFAPPGQAADAWTEKLSFESFGSSPPPDPIELLTQIANDQRATCTGFSDYNTFSGFENGYPTSIRLFVCRTNPVTQLAQITLVKAIQGNEQFYVITRARRVPPIETEGAAAMPAEDMAAWSLYLRAISLCDSARPAHPCPEPSE